MEMTISLAIKKKEAINANEKKIKKEIINIDDGLHSPPIRSTFRGLSLRCFAFM